MLFFEGLMFSNPFDIVIIVEVSHREIPALQRVRDASAEVCVFLSTYIINSIFWLSELFYAYSDY